MKKFISFKNYRNTKIFAILLGLSATIWFLIRVIPKPSRAFYPCMQAAAPLMSTFIIFLIGISTSVFSFKKFKSNIKSARYALASIFLVLSRLSFSFLILKDTNPGFAANPFGLNEEFPIDSNDPVGEAKGLFPGRVVWVKDARATNENYDPNSAGSDWWISNNNTDEEVVKAMLRTSVLKYTEETNINTAWDKIFRSFNKDAGRGDVGYQEGEKIAIKINLTNAGTNMNAQRMNASPQLINAVLHELTVNAGVSQNMITLGDPYRDFQTKYLSMVKTKYPDVIYVDGDGGGTSVTVPSADEVLVFSDKYKKSTLPQHYLDASYFINIPCLKTHNEGGITLIAKNHQGSFLEKGDPPKSQFAIDMHYSLPKNSPGTGNYRHTVDYMGHKDTGGKGLIYIIDGIWGGENWSGYISKFVSDPFNNDYPNSIFIGQDPVALESVGFDILFEEYAQDNNKEPYPIEMKFEIADYLSQCASSDFWPFDIDYDPEGDGSLLESLGVFEHWNNAVDRQYSRNLETGAGIELIYVDGEQVGIKNKLSQTLELSVSPNPFSDYTLFSIPGESKENSKLQIFNLKGQLVNELDFSHVNQLRWHGEDFSGNSLENGIYMYSLVENNKQLGKGKIIIRK